MKNYGYLENECCVIYTDECGDRQVIQFDRFEQANEFMIRCRNNGVCMVGMTTSAFYDLRVKDEDKQEEN